MEIITTLMLIALYPTLTCSTMYEQKVIPYSEFEMSMHYGMQQEAVQTFLDAAVEDDVPAQDVEQFANDLMDFIVLIEKDVATNPESLYKEWTDDPIQWCRDIAIAAYEEGVRPVDEITLENPFEKSGDLL